MKITELDEGVDNLTDIDIGDRPPRWAAWCLASRSPPHANEPKMIDLQYSPYRGRTLPPCDVGLGTCRRHGNLQGSLNEVATNGTSFKFDESEPSGCGRFELHGQDVVDVQRAMMISREQSRRLSNDDLYHDEGIRRKLPKRFLIARPPCSMEFRDGKKCVLCLQLPKAGLPLPFTPYYTSQQLHLGARAHRVALSLKEESRYISGGKYQRATFMGLPAEVHILILEELFRSFVLESKIIPKGFLRLSPTLWPITSFYDGIPTDHPLAILQTSKLMYSEGVKIFQRNAMFLSKFEPAIITGMGDNGAQNFTYSTKMQKPWPGIKRWKLTIVFPDQSESDHEDWMGLFPWSTTPGIDKTLPALITNHLMVAFKDGNTLDELILDLGPHPGGRVGAWGFKFSRQWVIKGLLPLAGKVGKLRIIGDYHPDLRKIVRLMEIFVQGYDDTPAGVSWPLGETHAIEAPTELNAFETDDDYNEEDEEDTDDEEVEPEQTQLSSGWDDDHEYLFLVPMWKALKSWTEAQTPTEQPEVFVPVVPSGVSIAAWILSSQNSLLMFNWILRLPDCSGVIYKSIGMQTLQQTVDWVVDFVTTIEKGNEPSAEGAAWISLAPFAESFTNPPSLEQDSGPAFLSWPNSDVEAATQVPLPEDPIHLPMIHVLGKTRPWSSLYLNIRDGIVIVADVQRDIGGAGFPKVWTWVAIPSFMAPKQGVYRLVGINGLPYESSKQRDSLFIATLKFLLFESAGALPLFLVDAELPDTAPESPYARRREEADRELLDSILFDLSSDDDSTEIIDNINPEYDGPEDDGLGWLEEAFDVDASDRLDGELKLDDMPDWTPLPLEVAIRFGMARG